MLLYPVKIVDDEGTFLVTFPDVPDAITYGETKAEAKIRAVDALEVMMMAYMDDKQEIPMPSTKGKDFIVLPALTTAKVLLYNAMLHARVSKSQLAKKIGCHAPQIERILDLNHASKVDQIERALAALGLCLSVGIEKAA